MTDMAGKPRAWWRLPRALIAADLHNISRDTLLAFVLVLPLIVVLIFRFAIPPRPELLAMASGPLAPEIEPYRGFLIDLVSGIEPMLMGVFVGMSPGLIGAVYGLLLVDERDERTLAVLRVMPVPFSRYLATRLALPCVLSLLITIAVYPIAGMAPAPMEAVALISIAGMTTVPMTVLIMLALAPNKVGALAVMRVVTAVLSAPALAYLATPLQEIAAWPIPSFWQMKALWLAAEGGPWVWPLALTLTINGALSIWLYHHFVRRGE